MSNLWKNYFWGNRTRHPDIKDMFCGRGIYFIGCGDKIVYIGQSIISASNRSIESLAKVYHKIDDFTLPWSIGLAPSKNEDLNELESTAIAKFAPIFNTSIPSKQKSKGREPKIIHIARVFADQFQNCSAFNLENLNKQAEEAEKNTSPPWEHNHRGKNN